MKSRVYPFASFGLLLGLLVGCSGQPPQPTAEPEPPADVVEPLATPDDDPATTDLEESLQVPDTTIVEEEITPEDALEAESNMVVEPPTLTPPEATDPPESAVIEQELAPQVTEPRQPVDLTESEAPYWPRFHGPTGDNLSPDTGLMKQWPDDGPPLEWTAEGIGNGYSSVSLAHGLIYTAGNLDGMTVISAIDLDGQIRWQVENGQAWEASYAGTRGTPTIDGDRLYHQSPLGNLICIVATTGEPVWAMNTLEAFDAENITWALAESLLIDGDHVITSPGGNLASMAALNKHTGEIVWITEPTGDQAGYASPVLVEHEGLRIIVTMNAKAVIGVDADSGRLLFRDPWETEHYVNAFMPLFHDGRVFVSTGYGGIGSRLLQLEVSGPTVSVRHVWESDELDNQHGGVILVDGYLYGSAHQFSGARWVCLDWETGELQWGERGVGRGSLTYADGMLYLFSERSRVGLARATPDEFALISEFRLPPGGQGASWAHPVVIGGRLYLRYDDRLLAYRVRAEENGG